MEIQKDHSNKSQIEVKFEATTQSEQKNTSISNQIDIHQRRLALNDSTNPKQHLITSILIYSSQYYPKTKKLLNQLVEILSAGNQKQNIELLYNCSKILSEDILREIVYGPSATYIPPAQIPHINRLDTGLLYPQNQEQVVALKDILTAHQALKFESIIPKGRVKQILWYTRSKTLSNSRVVNNRYISKDLRNQLQIGGQNWLDATPLAGLFVVLKDLWKLMLSKIQDQIETLILSQNIRLLLGRFSFLHNKILTNPVKQLSEDVFKYYETYIKLMVSQNSSQKPVTVNEYVQILIEYSYCLLFYYKYKKSQKLISKCCQLLEMQLQYTGKLGRRTKYQSFDCAQLIMNLKRKTNENLQQNDLTELEKQQQKQVEKFIFPNPKQLIIQEIQKFNVNQKQQKQSLIKQSVYDQENILLEKPKFTQQPQKEENQQSEKQKQQQFKITKQKIISALSMINYTYSTVPHDQMLFQYIATSLNTLLNHNQLLTYSMQFYILLLRSFNDFPRVKHAQRALEQLQTLKNQYELKQHKNVSLMFSTPYLTRFQFTMKFANRYMDIQMILTAVQLLKKAGMYEECVDGLIQRDYKQKALELVNQIIQQKGKTPRLLCMLGDIHHNDPKYYEEAWTLSQKRYGRAMRSLGWVYFNNGNYQKAAECFTYATQVNYYNPNTWFTLGSCYQRMNQFQKALRPFGQSVRIDQTQGQAWGNIASCYMHLKKMKQAYSTLQQAVKHSEGNWKIWSNLLTVSISLKQFYKFFECVQKIVKLNHSEIITKQIYNKIQMIMKFNLIEALNGKTRKRIAFNFKRRIDRLFEYLEQSIGQNPLVWEAKTNYLQTILDYLAEMYQHYRTQHLQKTLDQNDVIDGYETPQSTYANTQAEVSFCKQRIVDSKQKHLNMTMKVGWDENKVQCEKVYTVLKEYIQIYQKYNVNKDDVKQFRIFINGLQDKIQKCLETKVVLPLSQKM